MRRLFVVFLLLIFACTATNKANKFYQERNYSDAITECQRIIAQDSTNADAYFVLGKCYRAQGNLVQSIKSLNKAFQFNSSKKIETELVNTKLEYTDSLIFQQNFGKAEIELKSILDMDSSNTTGLTKLGDLYFDKAFLNKAQLQYKKLINIIGPEESIENKLLEIKKRTSLAEKQYSRGKASFEKYNYDAAVDQLEEALKNKADLIDAQYYLALAQGAILYTNGRKSDLWDAIEKFGKAMVLKPEAGEPHFYLALAYEKKDRREFDNAIQEYQLAIEKEPDGYFAKQCQRKIKELTELRDRLNKFWGK